ncbi:toprim domain-containing protein [Rhodopirellula sp. MGV]|uniref:toprim domain-containing protein n=1 Tax=Rhodopirellula sp. MGV TaxID=2023130 RepID=UPI000B970D7A|nr:toprim domain-containing protein [Rhodopirellula sp. MGV]PNY36431.1 DNA gyrase subunit B [Rhodopirellula baltica]
MNWITQSTKLVDCGRGIEFESVSGPYRELFVVEGDSASQSVARSRDTRYQAVLPMQGKPMNAVKASRSSVRNNQWFDAFVAALGIGWNPADYRQTRYSRVLLLFDPDADGIHCGALMLMFLERFFPGLLEQRRVSLIKAPMFQINGATKGDHLYAASEEHLRKIQDALDAQSIPYTYQRYRGLASLGDQALVEHCLDPNSRTAYLMGMEDAAMARRVFCSGGKVRE